MPSFLVALTAAILLISAPALAQQPTGGSKRAEASGKVFTEKEKEIIKGYFDKENAKKPDGDQEGDEEVIKGKGKDKDTTKADNGKDKGGKKDKYGDEIAEVEDDDDKVSKVKKTDKGKDKGGKGSDDDDDTVLAKVDDGDEGSGGSKKKGKGKGKSASGGGKGKSKKMPPGLAKRDELPPGLAMQVERNGTLPPGLAKRDLPSDLDDLLPTRKSGLERVIVEDDVVLVDQTTGVIMDILEGVARGRQN